MGKRRHSKETSTIEQLPDDVLLLILSFLTTLAEKARTTILSRRWRNLWLFTTIHLDFDATTVRHMDPSKKQHARYIEWVHKVINTRIALPGLPLVKDLRIQYGMDASQGCHIDRWVNFAIINHVETLHLDLLPYRSFFDHSEQYKLSEECWHKVPSGLSSLQCLKSLFLSCVNVSKQFIEFILSSCPLLEDLSLDFAGCYSDLDVSGVPPLRLRRLIISAAEDFALTKLCAPYLTSLHYESRKFHPQKIDVPMLTDLTVGGYAGSQRIMKYLEPFRSYLPQLEKLELMVAEVQTFSMRKMPKLDKLRYLKLDFNDCDADTDPISYRVIAFINACPMLETFAMRISDIDRETIRSRVLVQGQKKKLRTLEKSCLFKCLKKLKLYGADGKTIDQEITRFIIRNAPHLEKLSIDTRIIIRGHIFPRHRPQPEIAKVAEAKAKRLCGGSHSASTPAPAPAPFSSISLEADSKRRENECKKVRFNAYVEVLGGDDESEQLKQVEEEKKEGMEQVRIRITKKQLEELLGKVEVQSLSVHEMMSCLITEIHLSSSEPQEEEDHCWRAPVLKTIQEL